jgi:hypothetical protein
VHLAEPEEAYPTEIDARDRRAFEREARRDLGPTINGPLQDVIRSIPETYVLWLTWHSLKRGGTTIAWAEFESRAVLVESEGDDELVPTVTAATAD